MACGFDRAWRDIDWLDLRCASSPVCPLGFISGPGLGSVIDRFGLEQGEPEICYPTEQPLELGLIAHMARQRRVALGSRQRHSIEGECEVVAELSLDGQPIGPVKHVSESCTIDRALARSAGLSPG